jgi:hypothetical protein
VLREFRDKRLLTNTIGKRFVRWYYRYSPKVATFIEGHDVYRAVSRGILTPVVYAIQYPYGALMVVFFAGSFVLVMARRPRKEGRG